MGILRCNMLVEVCVHVSAIRCAFEFNISRGSVSTLGVSEPYIGFVLAASTDKRAVLVDEAIVSEVVMCQAVGL